MVRHPAFASHFQALFNICADKNLTVAAALSNLENIAFRWTFGPGERNLWEDLVACVALHTPSIDEDDKIVAASGAVVSCKSTSAATCDDGAGL